MSPRYFRGGFWEAFGVCLGYVFEVLGHAWGYARGYLGVVLSQGLYMERQVQKKTLYAQQLIVVNNFRFYMKKSDAKTQV